jgi:iron-sulfur cluster assembly protein
MIQLSIAAQDKLVSVLKDNPDRPFVRLGVKGGGCSGFEYSIGLVDEYEPDWELFEFGPVKVVVDPMSLMYLEDVSVDYIEGLDASGFRFTNPHVRSQCGCGKSFSV